MEGILDSALPSVEDSHEVRDHLLVDFGVSGSVDVLNIVFPLGIVPFQVDLVGERS